MRNLCLALALVANAAAAQAPVAGNVLILLADDVGADSIAVYGIGTDLPNTPRIDALAASGVRFANAWANPICSATRATLQTGRYPFRSGVGHLVSVNGGPALPLTERILPEMLDDLGTGYAHAAFGKWHLGNASVGGYLAPNLAGYSHYSGALTNFDSQSLASNYFQFEKVVDGVPALREEYATTVTVDDALAWIATAPEPWFCYVAFHAGHAPFHAPPDRLHTVDLTNVGTPKQNPRPYYRAMLEALDTEIGRLVDGLGPARAHTTIVFAGDNGTPRDVIVPPTPPTHAKGTAYEGGVHVPLIVSGPWIPSPGRVEPALVGIVDLFATVAELADVQATNAPSPSNAPSGMAPNGGFRAPFGLEPTPAVDSISLVPYLLAPEHEPLREVIYAEVIFPTGFAPPEVARRAIRGPRYKLIQKYDSSSGLPFALPDPTNLVGLELYDLLNDPQEQVNLLVPPLPRPLQNIVLDLVREMTDILE